MGEPLRFSSFARAEVGRTVDVPEQYERIKPESDDDFLEYVRNHCEFLLAHPHAAYGTGDHNHHDRTSIDRFAQWILNRLLERRQRSATALFPAT